MNKKYKCDHCGTRNPETFEGGRLTKCCAETELKEKQEAMSNEALIGFAEDQITELARKLVL